MGQALSVKALLQKLQIEPVNAGACTGPGNWIQDPQGEELISYNPTTGDPIATVIQATRASCDAVVQQAAQAFQSWRMLPAPKRGAVIRDFGNALRQVQEPLGELITLEMGKILVEAVGEVQEMIDICDFAVGLSRQLYGLTMQSERPGHRMVEQWHPLGPIGIITAFNFPVAVWSWNAAIAAVCGDTMVWKPSSIAPLSAIAVQHIANRLMADHGLDGIFGLAIGPGQEVGEWLINDSRLPLISFTGSVKMGRRVSQAVAGRLGRTILELGGNNAIIVTPDANLDLAVRAILFGAVGTAGQRCTTTRRIIAQRSIIDELAERLANAYRQVPIGDPLSPGTLVGPLVNEQAVEAMMAALAAARGEGGQVLCGGRHLPEKGPCFVEPAIVRMPRLTCQPTQTGGTRQEGSICQAEIVCEETFAPILYLLEYETLDEALALHNAVPQGLSSAIFTNNLLYAERFLSAAGSDCGIANVNIGTSGAEIGGAFGGEKDTGGGREAGSDAWKGYMRRQTVTINWSSELPLAQGIEFG